MNNIELNTEHYMIASLCPADQSGAAHDSSLVVSFVGNGLEIGSRDWVKRSCAERLELARAVIGYAAQFDGNSVLSWTFSPATVACSEAAHIAARWDQTREPPVFSLLMLAFDADFVRTTGLAAFVGVEIEVSNVRSRIRDAMNLTARLARHILLSGPSLAARTVSTSELKATLVGEDGDYARRNRILQLALHD